MDAFVFSSRTIDSFLLLVETERYQELRYAEESGLRYWWIICLKHSGASARVCGRYMITDWKPIFMLVKDSKPDIIGDLIHDVIESKPPDKSLNDWTRNPDRSRIPNFKTYRRKSNSI